MSLSAQVQQLSADFDSIRNLIRLNNFYASDELDWEEEDAKHFIKTLVQFDKRISSIFDYMSEIRKTISIRGEAQQKFNLWVQRELYQIRDKLNQMEEPIENTKDIPNTSERCDSPSDAQRQAMRPTPPNIEANEGHSTP